MLYGIVPKRPHRLSLSPFHTLHFRNFPILQPYRYTGFKFYFSSQYPFGIELIIERQYKTRDSNRITMIVRIASIATKETVDAVIFKTGYHFSISTETEFLVAVTIRSTCHFFFSVLSAVSPFALASSGSPAHKALADNTRHNANKLVNFPIFYLNFCWDKGKGS